MTMKNTLFTAMTLAGLGTLTVGPVTAVAQGTTFTFQGFLAEPGGPARGAHDLTFTLYNAASGGSSVGKSNVVEDLILVDGVFSVWLDFDAGVFTGPERWLEIAVRPGSSTGDFTTVKPRQKLTATPYALFAGGVDAAGIIGTVADDHLSENIARLDSDAEFTGTVAFSNAFGQFTGAFAGNGAGVTNVSLASIDSLGAITPNGGLFGLSTSPGVGSAPFAVVAADVNGDGCADLISANTHANALAVMTNNGHGTFAEAVKLPVGDFPRALVVADVNQDGWTDLACANFNADTLTVLTNTGRGGFEFASSPEVGDAPHAIATADVNGDGWPDLISANAGANSFTVLTNDGTGGFAVASSPGGISYPVAVAAADVNGDHWPDLIGGSSSIKAITILTNNGSGNFAFASAPAVGGLAYSVAVADVNGDGRVDLISTDTAVTNTLTVLTNDGSGAFSMASSLSVAPGPFAVVAVDVNRDGSMDLVSANREGSSLSVLTNDGAGGFMLIATPAVGLFPYSVATADVNGDGRPDLISANSGDATLTVLLNIPFNYLGNFTGSFADGRFTGGNFTGGTFSGSGAGVTNLNLPLNSGGSIAPNTNSFAFLASYGVAGAALEVVTEDIDRDGWVDLVTANVDPNSLTVLTNNRSGGFALATNMAVASESGGSGLVAVDLNLDGWVDLIRPIRNNETLLVLTNNGHGNFVVASMPATGAPVGALVATDLNGDGPPDLVLNGNFTTLTVLTNRGDGNFTLASTPAAGNNPATVATADVNGDGAMDVISGNGSYNTLTILTNDGSGGLVIASSPSATNPGLVLAVDVNGDRKVDLINANPFASLTVLTNDGAGGFMIASTPGAGGAVSSVTAIDFNENGRMDLICANYLADKLTILTNDGHAVFAMAASVNVGQWPSSVSTADVNRDGRPDLIIANAGDETLMVLVNSSLNFLGNFSGSFTGNGSRLTGISRLDAPDGNPAPALAVNDIGHVGIGTVSPQEKLTIAGVTGYNTGLKLTGNSVGGTGMALENTSPGGHKFDLISGGTADGIGVGAFGLFDETMGAYRISVGPTGNVGIGADLPTQKLQVIGNITASGTITPNSDVHAKTDFDDVDTTLILKRVLGLSIQQWRFKAEPESVRHVGPMAQDFQAAFGLGEIPTAIATVDADGVALAAIQALHRKLEVQNAENDALRERVEHLEQFIRTLAIRINKEANE